LADYRDHYQEIRAAGAGIVAISVDPPEKSESLRRGMRLPFPILCDTERRLVREWNVYNPHEKGGIAKPAFFVIERERMVRYSGVEGVASRTPAVELLRLLPNVGKAPSLRRKVYIPQLADFLRAIRNSIRS
jgi:peroxiredoxin